MITTYKQQIKEYYDKEKKKEIIVIERESNTGKITSMLIYLNAIKKKTKINCKTIIITNDYKENILKIVKTNNLDLNICCKTFEENKHDILIEENYRNIHVEYYSTFNRVIFIKDNIINPRLDCFEKLFTSDQNSIINEIKSFLNVWIIINNNYKYYKKISIENNNKFIIKDNITKINPGDKLLIITPIKNKECYKNLYIDNLRMLPDIKRYNYYYFKYHYNTFLLHDTINTFDYRYIKLLPLINKVILFLYYNRNYACDFYLNIIASYSKNIEIQTIFIN